MDVVACWGGRKVIISPHHYKITLCDLMTTLLSPIKEKKVGNILALEASAGNSRQVSLTATAHRRHCSVIAWKQRHESYSTSECSEVDGVKVTVKGTLFYILGFWRCSY